MVCDLCLGSKEIVTFASASAQGVLACPMCIQPADFEFRMEREKARIDAALQSDQRQPTAVTFEVRNPRGEVIAVVVAENYPQLLERTCTQMGIVTPIESSECLHFITVDADVLIATNYTSCVNNTSDIMPLTLWMEEVKYHPGSKKCLKSSWLQAEYPSMQPQQLDGLWSRMEDAPCTSANDGLPIDSNFNSSTESKASSSHQ
jgi:hypothetical protein